RAVRGLPTTPRRALSADHALSGSVPRPHRRRSPPGPRERSLSMNRCRLLSIVVTYVALHLPVGCTADQCTTIMQTPIVGEGLRALEKYLDGTIGVQGVGDAALCSANPNAPSPGSQPDAFNDHVQNCSQCLTDSCTREIDACEKDAICDGIANGRL